MQINIYPRLKMQKIKGKEIKAQKKQTLSAFFRVI